MTKKKDARRESEICKIVYFDEGSVSDYIQIVNGGNLKLTTELLDESLTAGEADASAKVRGGVGGALRTLLGFEASISAGASIETSFNSGLVAKSIVTNTVLTDFLSVLAEHGSARGEVVDFSGYRIESIDNSLSYMALLTPYMAMLKSGKGIPAGDFNISVEKLDTTIKNAKGYFEYLGCNDSKRVIFRFNNASFKNNYRASDLLRMDLAIYAVRVGSSTLDGLNINNELHVSPSTIQDNPDYEENIFAENTKNEKKDEKLEMYDVLLAGVKISD